MERQSHVEDMTGDELTFAEWVSFEANRIVEVGLLAPEQDRAGYMRVQIEAALWKAAHHFEDGFTATDPPRAVRRLATERANSSFGFYEWLTFAQLASGLQGAAAW